MQSVTQSNTHMSAYNFTKTTSIMVAIATLAGLALHDTKLDTMTTFALAVPVAVATYEGANLMLQLGGDSHTHVESVSLSRIASKNTSLNPWLPSRHNEDKRYRLQKNVPRGRHPFDNYTLPVLA